VNVTLIRPPAYSAGLMGAQLVPFLGIAYIGAAVRKGGHKVDIVDMCAEDIDRTEVVRGRYVSYGMPFVRLKERLKPSEVVAFTCGFSQDWVFNRALIKYVRKIFPESVFVAGGEHITALPEYSLDDCPELDICVLGEGEDVFIRLLEALEKKSDKAQIPSLVYRAEQGSNYHHTPRAVRIKDIDKIPLPAWDLIPIENYLSRKVNYHIRRGRTIPMLATRGCPYSCSFCSNVKMWGVPWIMRNPTLVAGEMEYYFRHYGVNNFVFSDLTAVVTKKGIIDLCTEILKRKIDITWQLPTLRTERVDHSVLKLMYKAGCRELDFAVESGSQKVLKSVNKRNNPEKIVSLIRKGLDIGMNLSINIILGLPEENFKDFLKSYFLVMKLALTGLQEVNAFPFIPYPGSKLFEEFLKEGKIKLGDDYFLGLFGYADLSRSISWSEKFSPATLKFMRLFLMSSFYCLMFASHPGRILQIFINMAKGVTTTKLEGVLKRVFKNTMARFTGVKKSVKV